MSHDSYGFIFTVVTLNISNKFVHSLALKNVVFTLQFRMMSLPILHCANLGKLARDSTLKQCGIMTDSTKCNTSTDTTSRSLFASSNATDKATIQGAMKHGLANIFHV